MAAFSYQYQQQPLHLDTVHNLQISEMKMSALMDECSNPTNSTVPQFYQSNNDYSLTNKTCTDSSSITDKLESGEQVTQKVTSMDKKRTFKEGSAANSTNSIDLGKIKGKKQKKNNRLKKEDQEKKPKEMQKHHKKATEEAPTGYIHVRARRGQATDSHSLAERVRREKISERMKLLQALVPGCDKVTGKALMLDEIINYVQSLQNQVEFLSMKLASLSPMFYDFGMDLDSLMARPDQTLSNLALPVQTMQQSDPMPEPIISDTSNVLATANNYSILDSSASVLFQQSQIAQILSQANGQLLWDVGDQRQKLINQSGFTNNLCSFH